MADTYGIIVQLSPLTYSWILEKEHFPEICSSEKIFLCGNKYVFSFRLFKITEISFDLFLCNLQKDTLALDIDIIMKYSNERKDFLLKKLKVQFLEHFLETIYANDLLYITFTFSNIQESFKSSCVTELPYTFSCTQESFKSNYETDKRDTNAKEEGYIRKNRNQQGEKAESIESRKYKGLIELSESLKNVFLDEKDSDVIFKIGDKQYPAYKVFIRARSPIFQAMLEHDMKEKNEGIINIEDCDPKVFQDFLFYLYTGKLETITKENVFELYRMSDKYDMTMLKEECMGFILKNLSVETVCDAICLATRYSERNLLDRAIEYFTDNAQDILPSVKWQNFIRDYPTQANELFLKTFSRLSPK